MKLPLREVPGLDRAELLVALLTRRSLSALQMAPTENINPIASEVLVEWNIYNGNEENEGVLELKLYRLDNSVCQRHQEPMSEGPNSGLSVEGRQ